MVCRWPSLIRRIKDNTAKAFARMTVHDYQADQSERALSIRGLEPWGRSTAHDGLTSAHKIGACGPK
jgi:hypothetical protein